MAAAELPVARGRASWGTRSAEASMNSAQSCFNARDGLVAQMLEHLERLVVVNPFAAVGLYKGLRYPLRPVE